MKTPSTSRRLLAVAGLALVALLLGDSARGDPVKVTIQSAKSEAGEGATLPIDPTIRVRYGLQGGTQMPGLGGMNGERLTFSPQGGHQIMIQVDGQITTLGQPPGKWESLNVPLGKGPGGKKREGVKSVWVINNVHITQIIEIIASKAPPKAAPGGKRHMDVMLVRYIVDNKDTKPHSVGVRNTIDIFLIDNDGALFASPQTHKDQVVNGHEFKGDKMPDYIQVLQRPDVKNPMFVTHFTLKVGKLEPPTKFVCTNLGACFNGGWDIPAQPAGDSAVGILFDPKAVASGGKRDMAFAYGIGIAANPENEGRVNLQVNGSFEPGKQFTVTAYVDDPLESQSLTLDLPPGLTRVDGKPIQAVPPPSEMNGSIVLWKVRVDQLGEFPIKVRSSNGMLYNTQLKIEAAEKSEIIRIEPKAAEPEKEPGPAPLTPKKKAKGAEELERLRAELRDARDRLQKLEVVQIEFQRRSTLAQAQLQATIAKLGANDPKVKDLQRQVDELQARGKEMAAGFEAQRAQMQRLEAELRFLEQLQLLDSKEK